MRPIKGTTVHAFHDASIPELQRHITNWLAAYNFARQLKALRWRMPIQASHAVWQQKTALLHQPSGHYTLGPNS